MNNFEIPMKAHVPMINFNPFIHLVEAKYGFDYRDMGDRYGWHKKRQDILKVKFPSVDYVAWSHIRPADMTDLEMEYYDAYSELSKQEPPYLDVWHWLIEHAFQDDLCNGSHQFLHLDVLERDAPDYVKTVLNAIFESIPEDHPARTKEGINFWIEW